MLRINLLPIRQLKKQAVAINQLIVAGFAVFALILILAFSGYVQSSIAKGIQSDINELNRIKAEKKHILDEIKKLEKKQKELKRRIDVIHKLKKNSNLAVRVMDEIANRIDNDRLWLLTFKHSSSSLSMTGVALDNKSIAEFMKSLEKSPYVVKQSINLKNSTLKIIAGKNLKSFALSCSVSPPPTEKTQPNNDKK